MFQVQNDRKMTYSNYGLDDRAIEVRSLVEARGFFV
jgi:hypothetical protein